MKAYVARNGSGSVTKGWLLRQGTSIDSSMARLPRNSAEDVEEVSVEAAVRGAARSRSGRRSVRQAEEAPALTRPYAR